MSLEHARPGDDGVVYDDRLYDRPAAAEILGVTVGALEQDAVTGRLGSIPFVKMGRLVRYRGATLKKLMREREQVPLGAPK
jgi:hypothetical protein